MKRIVLIFLCLGLISGSVAAGFAADPPPGMVLIPAGEYGAGFAGIPDEQPVHNIFIDAFYMDVTEVTQRAFEEVMGSRPSELRGPDLPVEKVTWYEARDYCAKVGKRLPTEAEWEKAARAGTDTTYPWGPEMQEGHAWHYRNSGRTTHPVGKTRPNGYGLYDMSGNVAEWVEDWYDAKYYARRSRSNPKSPFNGRHRVIRGGSFMDLPEELRVTRRNWDLPSSRFKTFGFRCTRSTTAGSVKGDRSENSDQSR